MSCISHWIPHSKDCCCCLATAFLCIRLVRQQVLTLSCNIFVLAMSVKTHPGFVSLLACSFTIRVWLFSFSWACTGLLVLGLQPWVQFSKVKCALCAKYLEDKGSAFFCLFWFCQIIFFVWLSDLWKLSQYQTSTKASAKGQRARDWATNCQTCSGILGTASLFFSVPQTCFSERQHVLLSVLAKKDL